MPRVFIDPELFKRERRQNTGGRPPFEPEDWQRKMVTNLAGFGVSVVDIGTLIGIDDNTIRKHLMYELEQGRAMGRAYCAGRLFQHIREGNFNALQFYMRVKMGWVEPKDATIDEAGNLATMSDDDLRREHDALDNLAHAASQARDVATRMQE